MNTKVKVVSPVGKPVVEEVSSPPPLNTLNGKTVCEVWNGSFEGHVSFPIIREMLQKRYPDVKVIPYTEFPLFPITALSPEKKAQRLEAVKVALKEKGCEAVIAGNGGWGTCTPAAVRPALVAEKAGIPSVVVAATSFLPLVHVLSAAEGVRTPRVAEYPSTIAIDSEAVIRENFEKRTFSQIIEALMKPAKKEEIKSKAPLAEIEGTLEEINESFYQKNLTDGLPIIPPTLTKVEEFLKYTDRTPHEQIAVLPPGNLGATPLIIAANGVMAGCRPEHMPILIAAVEAIADPHYDLEQNGTTAGLNPFLIINGPIIKQLGLEHGVGLVSRGPNPAIGRALGLIIRNIAGFKPGEQQMGTFGYILPFVLAEDEEGSPWEPFHVGHGFDRNKNTVTAGGTFNWGGQAFPSGTDPEGLLKIICREIVKHVNLSIQTLFGKLTMCTVVINPSVAQSIARGGYSKKDAEKYLFENSRVTIGEISFESRYGNAVGGFQTIRGLVDKDWDTPKEWADLQDQPEVTVPVMAYPGLTHIVVCGDQTRNKAMALYCCYNRPTIKEIKLPANWGKLMR